MKSLTELQQENAKMGQYIVDIKRLLNEGHVQLKSDLETTMTDVKQQLMQQLNATTGEL